MILRRFLRNNDLSPLFARAKAMLDPGWGVGVVQGGAILYAEGLSEDGLARAEGRHFSAPFSCNGHPLGHVVAAPEAGGHGSFAVQGVQQVVDMLATGVEMLLRQDQARRALASDTLQKYRELSLLHRATVGLNTSLRLRDVGRALLAECTSGAMPTEMGMLFLREGEQDVPGPNLHFGPATRLQLERVTASTLFQDIMRGGRGEIVNDLDSDDRWHGEVPGIRTLAAVPIIAADRRVGALVLASASDVPLEANHLQYLITLASVAGTAMGNAVHFEGIQTLLKALLQALATAIDARDPFTAGHSHRVARLAVALAIAVNRDKERFPSVCFDADALTEIYYAGLLHDVGKIGVREEVLTKATRLPEGQMELIGMRMALFAEVTGTPWEDDFATLKRINAADTISREDASLVVEIAKQELCAYGGRIMLLSEEETLALLLPRGNLLPEERREIERHPAEGYRILQHIPFPAHMQSLLDVIGQHHERLDGSGYPAGLKGGRISFVARILMIVDIFDAVTMERHYKPAQPRNRALAILEEEARQGKLDKDLVALMVERVDSIEEESLRLAMHHDFETIIDTRSC